MRSVRFLFADDEGRAPQWVENLRASYADVEFVEVPVTTRLLDGVLPSAGNDAQVVQVFTAQDANLADRFLRRHGRQVHACFLDLVFGGLYGLVNGVDDPEFEEALSELEQSTSRLDGFRLAYLARKQVDWVFIAIVTSRGGGGGDRPRFAHVNNYDAWIPANAVADTMHFAVRQAFRIAQFHLAGQVDVSHELLGSSKAIRAQLDLIPRLAAPGVVEPVLIIGETGTGKELFARAVHGASSRANRPFLPVNCAAIPETLLESELFGYMRGAFTGADRDRPGAMENADGGVLFLDEIGDMHPQSQGKVLRAIQEGEIVRLGARGATSVDVRVIAATNRDLKNLVQEGTFREDLFHRLNVLPVSLPPLRERRGDIADLAYVFLRRARGRLSCQAEGFSDELVRKMNAYGWPGNVRELENRIKRAAILHPECRILDVQHFGELAAGIRQAGSRGRPNFLQRHANWRAYSKEDFASMLTECNGVRAEVARRLGLKSPKAITGKAQKLGIPKGQAGRAKANSESD